MTNIYCRRRIKHNLFYLSILIALPSCVNVFNSICGMQIRQFTLFTKEHSFIFSNCLFILSRIFVKFLTCLFIVLNFFSLNFLLLLLLNELNIFFFSDKINRISLLLNSGRCSRSACFATLFKLILFKLMKQSL
jgi:hypothetical protein